ncbi:MAG: glycerol-3-phosphate acyltransferase [Clostridia bacterium]|nr:glycerol-3-phosphate acyltransferase [Clostridia bacterium]
MFGHTFPIFFGFKGGKGIATSLGVLLCMNWEVGLICLVFALVVMAVTRMVSAGSCTAAVLYPVLTLFGVQKTALIVERKLYNI